MSSARMVHRLGIVGDVHCESQTLERVLDVLDTMSLDAVLCVGDIVDGPGDADATLAMLEARGVECVAGNHERWFLEGEQRTLEHATLEVEPESRAFMEGLPQQRFYDTPAGRALLCHGVATDDEAWLLPDTRGYALQDIPSLRELMLDDRIQFMLGGHTHERMVRTFPGLTVVNVGTIHRKDEQTFAVVDFDAMRVAVYSAKDGEMGRLIEELPLPAPDAVE